MTLIAVAALAAGWALSVVALLGLFERQRRADARRVDLLVNQVCHLSGQPWHESPAVKERRELVGMHDEEELVNPDTLAWL